MAKKTLSVSLAVAMLATSNVPVWAAEFSDGSDAAFTSEVEAPVVEETPAVEISEEVAPAEAVVTSDSYSVAPVIEGISDDKTVEWDDHASVKATFTVTAKDSTTPSNIKFYYSWRINGLADTEKEFNLGATQSNIAAPALNATNAGSKLVLYICAKDSANNNNTVWSYTSDEIAIKAVDVTTGMNALTFLNNWDTIQVYDGKQHIPTKANINWSAAQADSNYFDISIDGDTTNVTDAGVKVTIRAKNGYTGEKVLTYQIKPFEIDNSNGSGKKTSDHFKATLNTDSFTYTGKTIKIKKSDVTVVDKDHPEVDLSNYLAEDEYGYVGYASSSISGSDSTATGIGYTYFALNLKQTPETGCKNYKVTANTKKVLTTNQANVAVRDLSSVDVSIKSQPIPSTGSKVTLKASDVTFKDKNTKETLDLNPVTSVIIPEEATSVGSYTVKIVPYADNNSVKGSTTATLTLVAADMTGATFTGLETTGADSGKFADVMYTGNSIKLTSSQLGDLVLDGKVLDKSVYDVSFGTNTDVGTGYVYVTGKDTFAGNKLTFTFDIVPAAVTASGVTCADSVELIDTENPAAYADAMKVVVKAKNNTINKEFTLEAGKDYKVSDYKIVDTSTDTVVANAVNKRVKATVTILNKNFKDTTSTFTIYAPITAATLKSEYIKLKQNSFTYTGKAITPAFDVRVDGRVIGTSEATGNRFTYEYINNTDAGTATLIVKGNGTDYKAVETKVTFKINPANTSDLGGVIASKEYTGYSLDLAEEDFNLTLNGERVNVKKNFDLTYGENLEVGEGTVTLTPKSGNFTGTRTFTFQIVGKVLNAGGEFAYYQSGVNVPNADVIFTYDGTEKVFDKTVFTYNGAEKLTEGKDYEIKYIDNIYGKKVGNDQKAAVLVIAKGVYGSTRTDASEGLDKGVYTDANGNKYSNVIDVDTFKISQLEVNKSNVSVSNGVYAGGIAVKPDVKVIVGGKVLVEGQDYDLEYPNVTDRVNATTSKSLTVKVVPKNGYKVDSSLDGEDENKFSWGIDKFNLANAVVTVDGEKVTVKCGSVEVPASEYTVAKDAAANTVTVTATKDNKNYTGSKTVSAVVTDPEEKPEAPMLVDVKVVGNKATAVLSGDSEGATGYDYVISKDRDCITTKDYDKIEKNKLTTEADFTYVQQGTYYAYCHAWKRDENGKKVFSDWSNAYPFVVTAITPDQPVITSVKASGSTVTVTYTQAANATGYDVVLGTATKKVAGETRPVNYGTLVKKNVKGNTVTVTFKNVEKGTYYAGLHAFNRTSEDGKKVFSAWSNAKKVTVK